MSSIGRLLALMFVGAISTMGLVFFVGIMGATDDGIDMSSSSYEDEYNATTEIAQGATSFMSFLPYILSVCILVVGVAALGKFWTRR